MSISEHNVDVCVTDVRFDSERLIVDFNDGRTISVPLSWYPLLFNASSQQRANFQISGNGRGIYWPDIDEDLSAEGLLRGAPAHRKLIDAE